MAAGHRHGRELFLRREPAEKILQQRSIVRVRPSGSEVPVDRVRRDHFTAADGTEALPARKIAHLDERILHRAVAVHRYHDCRGHAAADVIHALIHGRGYPAAVHREAEEKKVVRPEAEVIVIDCYVQRIRAELARNQLRNLFGAARRAEI